MANFNINRFNSFIRGASDVHCYVSGEYMDRFEGCRLECSAFKPSIEGVSVTGITSYRKMETDGATADALRKTVESHLASLHRSGCGACSFLVSDKSEVGVYFASEAALGSASFEGVLKGAIPEISTANGFIRKEELEKKARYGGVVTGALNLNGTTVEKVLDFITDKEAVVALIALPLKNSIANDYWSALSELDRLASAFSSTGQPFGSGSRITVDRQFPGIDLLKRYTEKACQRIAGKQAELWEYCIWFGTAERAYAEELGAKISGAMSAFNSNMTDKARYFITTDNPLRHGILSISDDCFGEIPSILDRRLVKGSLKSYVTTEELSGMFQLPQRSYKGLEVRTLNRTANDISLFDTLVPRARGSTLLLGHETETNREYRLSLDDFASHALVTGATGFGKSNTVKLILGELYKNNVPFCVIEAAKKEYWQLAGEVTNLRVYSAGMDAFDLKLNPLELEEGIVVSNHIDALMYCISGAIEMEEPTKLTLEGLICYSYKKKGWALNEIAYGQHPYPTLREVIDNIDEYTSTIRRSGAEIQHNIEAAVWRRLNSLVDGSAGNVLDTSEGLRAKDFCEGSTVIELDDLSSDMKRFVSSLVMIKINQYLSRQNITDKLNQVLVIEEAHNVMPAVSGTGNRLKEMASEYFADMLSQVRAYGMGLIISDQGASKINGNAVANTKIKITHSLSDGHDAYGISFAIHTNSLQTARLPELKTGQVIVTVSGEYNVCKVNVREYGGRRLENYGCLFCNRRLSCSFGSVLPRLEGTVDRNMAARLYSERFFPEKMRERIKNYIKLHSLSDCYSFCTFSNIVSTGHMPCGDLEKRRILYRYLNY